MINSVVGATKAWWRTPSWVAAGLIVSLALNLLVIGAVAGALWRPSPSGPHGGGSANLLNYTNTLPTDRRKQLWEATAEARRELRPLRREVRLAREEVLKTLAAEPFDKAKFMAAQTQLGEAHTRARSAVYNLYAVLASHLTPDERRGFRHWRDQHRPPGSNALDEPARR
jgi:uncharacterized membrane protein